VPGRPGRQKKVYDRKGKWIYRPEVFRVFYTIKSPKEICHLITNESLRQINSRLEKDIEQLAMRAHIGGKSAAAMFVLKINKCIETLDMMADVNSPAIKSIAAISTTWPVILSLNPQDKARAEKRLIDLGVGTKAIIRSKKKQRIDFRNLWTLVARGAFYTCWKNRRLVREFLEFTKEARYGERRAKFFGTEVTASYYDLNAEEGMVILDWQSACGTLPNRITEDNFNSWWNVIKGCVLEFWHCQPKAYKEALDKIGNRQQSISWRRNAALDRVKQALHSLTLGTVAMRPRYR
jgi:hypothetical protein